MNYLTPSQYQFGIGIEDRVLETFMTCNRYFDRYESVALFYHDFDRDQERARFVINTHIQPDLSKWGVVSSTKIQSIVKFVVVDAGLNVSSWDILNMSPQEIMVMLKTDMVSYRHSSFEEDVRGARPVIVCMGNDPASLLRVNGRKLFCMCLNLFV